MKILTSNLTKVWGVLALLVRKEALRFKPFEANTNAYTKLKTDIRMVTVIELLKGNLISSEQNQYKIIAYFRNKW